MRKRTRAVDWDDTLVDVKTQEWLPNAPQALRTLLHDGPVIIYTCRANWPEGLASIEAKLQETFTLHWRTLGLSIVGTRFTGDWAQTLRELQRGTVLC